MNVLQTAKEVCKTLEISLPTLREVMREAEITPSGYVRSAGRPSPLFDADRVDAISVALKARRERTRELRHRQGVMLAKMQHGESANEDRALRLEKEIADLHGHMRALAARLDRLDGRGDPVIGYGYVHTMRDTVGNVIGTVSNGAISE